MRISVASGFSLSTVILVAVIAVVVVVVILAVVLLLLRKNKQEESASGPQPNVPIPENQGTGSQVPLGGATGPCVPPAEPGVTGVAGIAGVMTGRVYPLGTDNVTLGRDPSCQIRFPAETQGVSRIHARLFRNGQGQWMLMDCGSSQGTLLQGYGRMMPQHPVPVKVGATFYLGSEQNGFTLR